MAQLEEFIQEKYIENFETLSDVQNKVEKLMNLSSCSGFFYDPSSDGIGGLQYIVDSEGHALYLIKKSGLPDKIKESLVGGDAGNGKYNDYASLSDVYGVTSDLKIYYCSDGLETIVGVVADNLDVDNPRKRSL